MNILVTGAAGYIGSICSEVLLSRGMKVIALDSLRKDTLPRCRRGAVFWNVDLGNRQQIESVFTT